jgi:hypothetical protein
VEPGLGGAVHQLHGGPKGRSAPARLIDVVEVCLVLPQSQVNDQGRPSRMKAAAGHGP